MIYDALREAFRETGIAVRWISTQRYKRCLRLRYKDGPWFHCRLILDTSMVSITKLQWVKWHRWYEEELELIRPLGGEAYYKAIGVTVDLVDPASLGKMVAFVKKRWRKSMRPRKYESVRIVV